MFTSALSLPPPMRTPLKLMPPSPPVVLSWTCVIEPRTRSWAGVICPVAGAFLPPAMRPPAARSCSAMAAPRISASPRTMNLPEPWRASVMIVEKPLPISHCPCQPASFSNLETVME